MKKLKHFALVITSLFLYVIHAPFALAKSASHKTVSYFRTFSDSTENDGTDNTRFFPVGLKSVYDSLQLNIDGLSKHAYDLAIKGFKKLKQAGELANDSVLSIIDFSQPSSSKRLYVLDLKNYKILFNTYVAHGKNSGKEWAQSFSNQPHSYKSSLGFYITGDTYNGNNGYSLKLEGVEKGVNDKAYHRAIVIHGAEYVDESYIESQGYIGRSEGCPAVPVRLHKPIINTIKEGSCLFIYHPDKRYELHSRVLN
jgi:hypothetical protein